MDRASSSGAFRRGTVRTMNCPSLALVTLVFLASGLAGHAQTAPAGQTPADGRGASTQQPPPQGGGRRASPPQPQQKQSPDYFEGTWSFEWLGRESPLTAGPRTGSVTFSREKEAVLTITSASKTDTGTAVVESGTMTWNPTDKTLAFVEKLADGTSVAGTGNWSSPLAIRYESQPVTVKGQTLRLRRIYSIVAAQSFRVAEEMSTDGGPFQRLGSGNYTKK
jgi:hypothetical protein